MFTIKVKVWSALAPQFGLDSGQAHNLQKVLPDGGRLADLLEQLAKEYPRFGDLVARPGLLLVTLNAEVEPDLQQPLRAGDMVGLVPAYQGG